MGVISFFGSFDNSSKKFLFLSILAEQCGRYKDMVNFMEEIVKSKNEDLERLKRYWYCWRYLQGKINSVSCNNIIHPDRLFR